MPDYPNILYIHSHDTGRYVQPYGHAVPTPRLQQLAEQGILFRQAFSAAPTCSPSRASLLTGQSPHNNGMLGLAHRGFALYDYGQHIIHTLHKVGYHSALIGEQHIAKDPGRIGYKQVIDVAIHRAEVIAPLAQDFLRSAPAQPFFLSVGFSETHRKLPQPASEQEANYCLPPSNLPDTPEIRQDMAAFKTSARSLDQGIGSVLDELEASGLAEKTLVICTTDHGIPFPGCKGTLTDRGIGVMLMMRGPDGFSGGQVCDALVSHIDLFATLCDLLHIEAPSWLQGVSLLPLIRHETDEIHDAIFGEVTYHAAYEPQRAMRTKRWKYIRRFDYHRGPVLPNCDDSPSKEVLLSYGWREREVAREELYDLLFDPNEGRNLASDPAASAILIEMRNRLMQWMQATNDPLLNGPVAAPASAELNDPDQLSPEEPTHII